MSDVGFVGTGAMGSRMARRLIDEGHSLYVWNRTTSKTRSLEEAGATVAASPADAARSAEVIITMVADDPALRAVIDGHDGIAAGAADGCTLIEMSTVGPATIDWLARALPRNTQLLDAPVLGSLSEAEEGALKIFAAGERELLERWRVVLSAMGEPTHVGSLGAGKAAKLVANSTLFGTLGVLGEAIALGDGLGLERDVIFEVLSSTPIAAQAKRRRPAIEKDDYPMRFALSLARKDAELIAQAAEEVGVDLKVAAAARRWVAEAEKRGWGERDYSAVIGHIVTRP